MFKRFHKPLILAVCLAMLISGMAGCSANGGKAGASAASTDSSKISPTERDVSVVLQDHPDQPMKNFAPAQQEIFKETNIKLNFEIVARSNYDDKKKVLLATNNLPDIMRVGTQDINDFGSTGIFLQLDPYLSKMSNFKKVWTSTPDYKKTTVDDKLYGFPTIRREEAKYGAGPVIRMDLLKKNNIAVPKTFDDLLTALEQLKKIYPQSVPWTGRKGTIQLFQTAAYMFGTGYGTNGIYYDKDKGKYIFGPATEEFKQMLAYFNKAYKAGVLDPDYATTTAQQWTEKMTSGKAFFFIDNSGFGITDTRALRKTDPDGLLQLIDVPKNSYGKARAQYYSTTFTGDYWVISSKAKDPDTLVRFMDWLYSEQGSNISNFGVPGVSFDLDSKGQPQFRSDYVSKFKDGQPSPYYALYSDLGITLLNFAPWAANTLTQFQIMKMTGNWDDLDNQYWSINNADKAYQDPVMDPSLTKDEAARVKELNVTLSTMLSQEYDKFIMGTKDISQYDAVIAKAKSLGSTELEKIYNDANTRASSGSGSSSKK